MSASQSESIDRFGVYRLLCCGAWALTLLLAACTTPGQGPGLAQYGAGSDRLELKNTAFFPRQDRYAAAAALATLLYTDGVRIGPDSVTPMLGPDDGAIALQPVLRSAAARFERLPLVLAPKLDALISELRDGHPVLVLLNLGTSLREPVWRYAVLVGYEPASNSLLLRSGTEGRARMQPREFLRDWTDGGSWAMTVAEAGKIPATTTLPQWLEASKNLTRIGKPAVAEAAAQAALLRWPEQPLLATVALGNARYARMDWPGAQSAYLQALALKDVNPVVHNNLALVLLGRRCVDLAEQQVALAIEHETDPALRQAYAQTETKIKAYSGPRIFCPPLGADGQAPIEYDVLPLNQDSRPAPRARRKRPN